ncbi:hypothetical protein [Roseobacter cerasinus]|uniref:hypothetical protein n=1 Tax=Roseobacter cerasinus TaxID=2602289 RepID=UPI00135C5C23|nr:hypothetical protein [Roseobacter cerasinus]
MVLSRVESVKHKNNRWLQLVLWLVTVVIALNDHINGMDSGPGVRAVKAYASVGWIYVGYLFVKFNRIG